MSESRRSLALPRPMRTSLWLRRIEDRAVATSLITDALIWASVNGYLDCLKYLLENGCELHESAMFDAANNGHLSCLKILYEHGCPYGEGVWNRRLVYVSIYMHDKKMKYEPDIVLEYISDRDAKINVAKKARPYVPTDIWNIIRMTTSDHLSNYSSF